MTDEKRPSDPRMALLLAGHLPPVGEAGRSKHEQGLRDVLEEFVGIAADELSAAEKKVVLIANNALDRPYIILDAFGSYVRT